MILGSDLEKLYEGMSTGSGDRWAERNFLPTADCGSAASRLVKYKWWVCPHLAYGSKSTAYLMKKQCKQISFYFINFSFELCLASFTIYVFSVQSWGGRRIQLLHGQAVVWLTA